jgi:hypothetical protein
MKPGAAAGMWEQYQTAQRAAFPSASFIAIAQFSGQPLPESVKESSAYTEAQALTNDVNAAIANPDLAADLGVVPGSEKYSVATAFDPNFPAKQQEAARQAAAKAVINGTPDDKKAAGGEKTLDTTATMYDGKIIDFSSNKFVDELMKDKKYISDTLESLTKESEATKKVLDGYMKGAADAKMERQSIENTINNIKSQAYRELAGSGASQSSVDALAAWRTQALEPALQAALIKEQNANAIYLGQKELMQQDWDRKLKATDTYEKLANIDATIFSTVSQRQYQQQQLAVEKQKLAQDTTKLAPGEVAFRTQTGEQIAGQNTNIGEFDFGGGEKVAASDLATRLVKGDPAKKFAAVNAIASAGNEPKAQLDVLYSLAASKENDPDQVVESSSQMVKKMQTAIAAIRKNPGYFGIGAKYQDLISAINSQDPKYAELKAAVQAVQAGITTGMFGSRDSSAQMSMTDQMANALKAPNAETALKIMAQVSGQVYRSAIGHLTAQGLSQRQADVLFRHHITSI